MNESFTAAERALIDRYTVLAQSVSAGYQLMCEVGLTPEQSKTLDAQDAKLDALYPQLPQRLRDAWNG